MQPNGFDGDWGEKQNKLTKTEKDTTTTTTKLMMRWFVFVRLFLFVMVLMKGFQVCAYMR